MIAIDKGTIRTLVAGVFLLVGAAASNAGDTSPAESASASATIAEEVVVPLVPPPSEVLTDDVRVTPRTMQLANYPCMECHQHVNAVRPGYPDHKQPHRNMHFDHMRTLGVCSSCHPPTNYDKLWLLDKTMIPFDESYRVCGQCHAEKFRDWGLNIHGKQIGSWQRNKVRTTCVACHPPHAPRFPQMKADAAPVRPRFGVPKGEHE